MSENDILGYDPFADDKDGDGWTDVSRKLVRVRKDHLCGCDGTVHYVRKGEWAVVYTAVRQGNGWRSFHISADCIARFLLEWG